MFSFAFYLSSCKFNVPACVHRFAACLKTQSWSGVWCSFEREQTKSTMVPIQMHNAALKSKGQSKSSRQSPFFGMPILRRVASVAPIWVDQSSKVKTRPKQVAHQGSVSLKMCQLAVQGAEVENGERSSIKVPKFLSVLAVFNTNSGNS